jgi:hypothetical protein
MTSWWKKPEKYYTTSEFAELIGWPARQVRLYIRQQMIRTHQRSRREYLIPEKELLRWGLLEEKERS